MDKRLKRFWKKTTANIALNTNFINKKMRRLKKINSYRNPPLVINGVFLFRKTKNGIYTMNGINTSRSSSIKYELADNFNISKFFSLFLFELPQPIYFPARKCSNAIETRSSVIHPSFSEFHQRSKKDYF